MFKHYLATALRHFRQHKMTTGINLACLMLGLACFILAWGMVAYFEKADGYHARADRTYFLTTGFSSGGAKFGSALTNSPWVLAESLRVDFPQLESVARTLAGQEMPVSVAGRTRFEPVAFADPQFMRIFDLPFAAGNAATALDAPRSAIVSTALAQRLFGSESAIGRTLRIANAEDVTITGVVAAIAQPSHISTQNSQARLYFDVLASMDTHVAIAKALNPEGAKLTFSSWGLMSYTTYLVLPKDGSLSAGQLDSQLDAFSRRRVPATDGGREFRIRPMGQLRQATLNSIVGTDRTGVSSTAILQLLGGLVLLVSCLNYANLATAQAATRGKEVAMQKVVGASARQVMLQHFFEASLLVWAALALAILAIGLVALSAGATVLAGLAVLFLRMPQFWICVAALLVATSLLGGAYPALALSRVRPIQALRSVRVNTGSSFVSTLLVGLQFGSASFLIVAVLVMSAQNANIKKAVINSSSDPVVILSNNLQSAAVDRSVLKSQLLKTPGVKAVSSMQGMPWTATLNSLGALSASPQSTAESAAKVQKQTVDADFFAALDIPLLAGRGFSIARAEDEAVATGGKVVNVIIDRSLARLLGYDKLQDAVGRTVYSYTSWDGSTPPEKLNVIGVVEDATLKPLSYGFSANYYLFNSTAPTVQLVRISKREVSSTLAGIDDVWHRLAPDEPIKRRFADEQFDQAFGFLHLLSGTFGVLAGFASAIAVMGLVGMALHIIRRRTHEIGVRKTLGASVLQILMLLLSSFSRPVVIANVIAWPLVYLTMSFYLSMFVRSTALTPAPFLASLAITLLIAWLAVIAQAIRAARLNPATVLRYE